MSPIAVFIRVLVRSSAIFLGFATIFLHPSLEWRPAHTDLVAQQESREEAVDGLIAVLADSDAGVRREAAVALGRLGNPRAVTALARAVNDPDPDVRREAARALRRVGARSIR